MRDPLASMAAIVSLSLSAMTLASAAESRFEFEMAAALSGPCCGDSGQDIAVDADGSFFIVGNYGSIDFDGDGVPEGAVRCDVRGDIVWAGYALRPTGASSGK